MSHSMSIRERIESPESREGTIAQGLSLYRLAQDPNLQSLRSKLLQAYPEATSLTSAGGQERTPATYLMTAGQIRRNGLYLGRLSIRPTLHHLLDEVPDLEEPTKLRLNKGVALTRNQQGPTDGPYFLRAPIDDASLEALQQESRAITEAIEMRLPDHIDPDLLTWNRPYRALTLAVLSGNITPAYIRGVKKFVNKGLPMTIQMSEVHCTVSRPQPQ